VKLHRVTLAGGALVVHGTEAFAKRVAHALADAFRKPVRIAAEKSPARGDRTPSGEPGAKRKARGRTKSNPGTPPAVLERAAQTHRRWAGFDPKHVTRVKHKGPRTIPSTLVQLGELVEVVYESDKWDGERRLYAHETSKPRPKLCTGPDGEGFYIVGGRMKVTPRGIVG